MSKEAPLPYTPPSRRTVERIINYLEGDYIDLIPRLEQIPDEATIASLYGTKALRDLLIQRDISPAQRAVVTNTLRAISHRRYNPPMTVGEIRRMADIELLGKGRRGGSIGPRKLEIIRKLFGKIPEDNFQ